VVSTLLLGKTLRDRLQDGAWPMRAAVGYRLESAHRVIAAPNLEVVHRDLKPEHIFITLKSGARPFAFPRIVVE